MYKLESEYVEARLKQLQADDPIAWQETKGDKLQVRLSVKLL